MEAEYRTGGGGYGLALLPDGSAVNGVVMETTNHKIWGFVAAIDLDRRITIPAGSVIVRFPADSKFLVCVDHAKAIQLADAGADGYHKVDTRLNGSRF